MKTNLRFIPRGRHSDAEVVPRRAEKLHIRPHESKEELLDRPQGIARVVDPRTGPARVLRVFRLGVRAP